MGGVASSDARCQRGSRAMPRGSSIVVALLIAPLVVGVLGAQLLHLLPIALALSHRPFALPIFGRCLHVIVLDLLVRVVIDAIPRQTPPFVHVQAGSAAAAATTVLS